MSSSIIYSSLMLLLFPYSISIFFVFEVKRNMNSKPQMPEIRFQLRFRWLRAFFYAEQQDLSVGDEGKDCFCLLSVWIALEDLRPCATGEFLYWITLLAAPPYHCCLSDFGCSVNPIGGKSLQSRLCLPDFTVTVTKEGTKILLRPGRSTATRKRKLLTLP